MPSKIPIRETQGIAIALLIALYRFAAADHKTYMLYTYRCRIFVFSAIAVVCRCI